MCARKRVCRLLNSLLARATRQEHAALQPCRTSHLYKCWGNICISGCSDRNAVEVEANSSAACAQAAAHLSLCGLARFARMPAHVPVAPCAGDADGYAGEAVNPQNLSLWERVTGVGACFSAARASSKIVDLGPTPNGKP